MNAKYFSVQSLPESSPSAHSRRRPSSDWQSLLLLVQRTQLRPLLLRLLGSGIVKVIAMLPEFCVIRFFTGGRNAPRCGR